MPWTDEDLQQLCELASLFEKEDGEATASKFLETCGALSRSFNTEIANEGGGGRFVRYDFQQWCYLIGTARRLLHSLRYDVFELTGVSQLGIQNDPDGALLALEEYINHPDRGDPSPFERFEVTLKWDFPAVRGYVPGTDEFLLTYLYQHDWAMSIDARFAEWVGGHLLATLRRGHQSGFPAGAVIGPGGQVEEGVTAR